MVRTFEKKMVTGPQISFSSPIGLVAGNGSLPISFVNSAQAQGYQVVVVGHIGETDERLERQVDSFKWVRVGQVGTILSFLKRHKVQQMAFAGGIKRINLFGGVRVDRAGLRILARARSLRDDRLLREIASEFEARGIEVIAPSNFLKDFLPLPGYLANRRLTSSEREDLLLGWEVAKELGRVDVGQAVVTFEGVVVAVEAVEGTDALIERAGSLTKKKGGVLVKVPKPQQDLRLDMPTVGQQTVLHAASHGLSAIVVEAGKTLILDPVEVVRLANQLAVALLAVEDGELLL